MSKQPESLNKALSIRKTSFERSFIKPKALNEKQLNQKINQIQYTAHKLVERYNAPTYEKFFLKCGWHLSEAKIWDIEERSHSPKIRSSLGYFIKCCKAEMTH